MFRYVIALMIVLSCSANAHQFLPTYPKFQNSFVEGVVYTKMELFNKRKEIVFYELGVFDGDWNSITFATESKIIRVNYLETKYINVYIKKEDLKRAVYICTESKIKKEDIQATSIASKICSKIK
jgi:activator of HSP90 ATPase